MIVESLALKYGSNVASNTKLWFKEYSPLVLRVVSSRLLTHPQSLDKPVFSKSLVEIYFPMKNEWNPLLRT